MRVKSIILSLVILSLSVPALAQSQPWITDDSGRVLNESQLRNQNNVRSQPGFRMDNDRQQTSTRLRWRRNFWRVSSKSRINQRLRPQMKSRLHYRGGAGTGLARKNRLAQSAKQETGKMSAFYFRRLNSMNRLGNRRGIRSASLRTQGRAASANRRGSDRIRVSMRWRQPSRIFRTAKMWNKKDYQVRQARAKRKNRKRNRVARNQSVNSRVMEAAVKNAMALYVQVKSNNGMFAVNDPATGKTWNSWMVSHPKVRRVGRDFVAQAGFYGHPSDSNEVLPMVVQFRLKGQGKSWHVKNVKMVNVNNVKRPGVAQFIQFVASEDGTLGTEEIPVTL